MNQAAVNRGASHWQGDERGWIDVSVPLTDKMVLWPGDGSPPRLQVASTILPTASHDSDGEFGREDPGSGNGSASCRASDSDGGSGRGSDDRNPSDSDSGSGVRLSRLELGLHAGTHLDAPAHYLADGGDITTVPLNALIGPALVLDLSSTTSAAQVDAGLLEKSMKRATARGWPVRLLLRTANSARSLLAAPQFHPDFVGLLPDAADLLVRHGVALIGIDYLSIEPYEQSIGSAPVHRRLLAAGIAIVEGIDLRQVAAGWYELIVLPLRLPGAEASPVRALLRPLTLIAPHESRVRE